MPAALVKGTLRPDPKRSGYRKARAPTPVPESIIPRQKTYPTVIGANDPSTYAEAYDRGQQAPNFSTKAPHGSRHESPAIRRKPLPNLPHSPLPTESKSNFKKAAGPSESTSIPVNCGPTGRKGNQQPGPLYKPASDTQLTIQNSASSGAYSHVLGQTTYLPPGETARVLRHTSKRDTIARKPVRNAFGPSNTPSNSSNSRKPDPEVQVRQLINGKLPPHQVPNRLEEDHRQLDDIQANRFRNQDGQIWDGRHLHNGGPNQLTLQPLNQNALLAQQKYEAEKSSRQRSEQDESTRPKDRVYLRNGQERKAEYHNPKSSFHSSHGHVETSGAIGYRNQISQIQSKAAPRNAAAVAGAVAMERNCGYNYKTDNVVASAPPRELKLPKELPTTLRVRNKNVEDNWYLPPLPPERTKAVPPDFVNPRVADRSNHSEGQCILNWNRWGPSAWMGKPKGGVAGRSISRPQPQSQPYGTAVYVTPSARAGQREGRPRRRTSITSAIKDRSSSIGQAVRRGSASSIGTMKSIVRRVSHSHPIVALQDWKERHKEREGAGAGPTSAIRDSSNIRGEYRHRGAATAKPASEYGSRHTGKSDLLYRRSRNTASGDIFDTAGNGHMSRSKRRKAPPSRLELSRISSRRSNKKQSWLDRVIPTRSSPVKSELSFQCRGEGKMTPVSYESPVSPITNSESPNAFSMPNWQAQRTLHDSGPSLVSESMHTQSDWRTAGSLNAEHLNRHTNTYMMLTINDSRQDGRTLANRSTSLDHLEQPNMDISALLPPEKLPDHFEPVFDNERLERDIHSLVSYVPGRESVIANVDLGTFDCSAMMDYSRGQAYYVDNSTTRSRRNTPYAFPGSTAEHVPANFEAGRALGIPTSERSLHRVASSIYATDQNLPGTAARPDSAFCDAGNPYDNGSASDEPSYLPSSVASRGQSAYSSNKEWVDGSQGYKAKSKAVSTDPIFVIGDEDDEEDKEDRALETWPPKKKPTQVRPVNSLWRPLMTPKVGDLDISTMPSTNHIGSPATAPERNTTFYQFYDELLPKTPCAGSTVAVPHPADAEGELLQPTVYKKR